MASSTKCSSNKIHHAPLIHIRKQDGYILTVEDLVHNIIKKKKKNYVVFMARKCQVTSHITLIHYSANYTITKKMLIKIEEEKGEGGRQGEKNACTIKIAAAEHRNELSSTFITVCSRINNRK